MKHQFLQFLLRWLLNSFGLWVAARLLQGSGIEYDVDQGYILFFFAGLMLSLVNVILKPILIILSLPAILLTLGLFTLIVNGFIVYLAAKLVPGLEITFWASVVTGMILSLINFVLTNVLDVYNEPTQQTGRRL